MNRTPLLLKRNAFPLARLLRSKFLWQFTLAKIFSDPVWYFYTFRVPQYLKVVHGYGLRQIGETAWIPFLTAVIGNLAGGAAFRELLYFRLGVPITRRIAVVVFSSLMACAIFIPGSQTPVECNVLISIATFGYCAALTNLLANPGDVFPKETVASIWSFASMGSGFGAMTFSLLTAWLVDRYSFQPAFVLFGILPMISAGIVWFLSLRAVRPSPA